MRQIIGMVHGLGLGNDCRGLVHVLYWGGNKPKNIVPLSYSLMVSFMCMSSFLSKRTEEERRDFGW